MAARPTVSTGIVARRSLVFARALLVGSVLLLWPCCVAADSLADARSALKQQDFATAHTMFELEARRGNAAAMNELGYSPRGLDEGLTDTLRAEGKMPTAAPTA